MMSFHVHDAQRLAARGAMLVLDVGLLIGALIVAPPWVATMWTLGKIYNALDAASKPRARVK